MAAKFEVESKKSDVHSFFPEDIDVKAHLNGRTELPDIDGLTCSILTHGQLQNVVIRKDGLKPSLGLGFSRWRAVSHINELVKNKAKQTEWLEAHQGYVIPSEPIRLRCEFKQWNEQEMFLANIAENLHRNPTTDMDAANNVAQLDKWGIDHAKIAATFKRPESWVKKCLKIASVEPEVKQAVKDGRVKLSAMFAIAKLSADQQRAKVEGDGPIEEVKEKPKKKFDLERLAALAVEYSESEKNGTPHGFVEWLNAN